MAAVGMVLIAPVVFRPIGFFYSLVTLMYSQCITLGVKPQGVPVALLYAQNAGTVFFV